MTAAPLLNRIGEAVGRAHDVNLELLELADELKEHATRAFGMTERLQKSLKSGLDHPAVVRLPRGILPKRDDGLPSDVEPKEAETA